MISIEGLNKADVLAALYNHSQPLGMGILHYDPKPMEREQAEVELKQATYNDRIYFDYLHGRVMKSELSSDIEFDPRLYDRDNGQGAAKAAIDTIREDL